MRALKKYALDYRHEPLYVITARFNAHTSLQLGTRTVFRYIRKLNMNGFIAVQKPFLSKKNISRGILCARTHPDWTLGQCSRVKLTDESRFDVSLMKNRQGIWRCLGVRMRQPKIVPTFKSGYQVVSVCAGFALLGRTPLVGSIGSFDKKRTVLLSIPMF